MGKRFRDTVLSLGGGRAPALVFKVKLLCLRHKHSIFSGDNDLHAPVFELCLTAVLLSGNLAFAFGPTDCRPIQKDNSCLHRISVAGSPQQKHC